MLFYLRLCLLALALACLSFVVHAANNEGCNEKRKLVLLITTVLLTSAPGLFGFNHAPSHKKRRLCQPHRIRTRKRVEDIMDELGPHCVQRAHKIEQPDFRTLGDMLNPSVDRNINTTKLKGAKNGLITPEI